MKKYLIWTGILLVGVFLSDTIKPMLSGLPVIGSMFGGNDDESEAKDGE